MKKNKMMRLASGLLVLTLLTTSIIGGTFAKYTTASTGSDTARVAKWGVKLDVNTDLFAQAYKDTAVTDNTATVKVGTTDVKNLVAPGTKGTGLNVKNTAASEPEVSYNMTIKLNNTDDPKMPSLKYKPTSGSETVYEPVKFNIYNGTEKLNKDNALTLSELQALFNGTKSIYTYDVAAKKYTVDSDLDGDLSDETPSETKPEIKVEWEWAFEDTANKALYDELDTILGDTAAGVTPAITQYSGGGDNSISDIKTDVSLSWTVTATQID